MRRRRTALVTALALTFAPWPLGAHEGAGAPEISERECGKAALALLLMMEKIPDQARRLDSRLADPPEAGYSVLELQDAARACGLEVEPVELGRGGAEIGRPMLALLSGPSSNHYILTRPIPGRRPLVQVIDPRGFSAIVDRDELTSSPAWTGFVLRPERTSLLGPWGGEAAIGAAVAGATYVAGAVLSRRSSGPTGREA